MNRRSSRVGTTTVTDGSSAGRSRTAANGGTATATDMDFNRTPPTGDEAPTDPGADASRWLLTRGSQYSIASLVKTVAVVALTPLATRVLVPAEMGAASTALVVANLLVAFAALGLHSAAMRAYYGGAGDDPDPHLARTLSWMAIAVSVAAAFALHLSGPAWVSLFGELRYSGALQLAVAATVPMTVLVVAQNLLRAEDRAMPYVVAAVVATVGGQLLGVTLAWTGSGTATEYLTGVVVGYALGGTASMVAANRRGRRLQRGELGAALRLGAPTIPHSLGILLLQMGDRIVIEGVEGLGSVGRYQVAYLVGSVGILAVQAFSAAWGPMIFGATERDRWPALATTTATAYRLVALIVAGVGLSAPLALRVAAPSSYDTASLVPVVVLVAPSALAFVLFQSSATVLFHHRRTGLLGLTSAVAAAANLGLCFALVPVWGLAGAAVATAVTYTGWAVAVRRLADRTQSVPWISGVAPRSVLVAGLGLTAGVLVPTVGPWMVLRVVLIGILALAAVRAIRHELR